MELTYRKVGDYYLPNLTLPESPKVGKYGMLRRTYLRHHRRGLYTGMMISRTLNAHLEEVDQQANDMLERIVKQMAKEQGITEQMKADDQMEWVWQMNAIRAAAEEVILKEFVYS